MGAPRIGFVGAGNMAAALIRGMLATGMRAEIRAAAPGAQRLAALGRDCGIATGHDNAALGRWAQIVVLAVKPHQAPAALRGMAGALAKDATLVSVAAGLRCAAIRRHLGPGGASVPMVRAMPNIGAQVQCSATGLYADGDLPAARRRTIAGLFEAVGMCLWLPREEQLDSITALCGSGIAWFFYLAELMARAAADQGLDADAAARLAVQCCAGAARLAGDAGDADDSGPQALAQLRRRVCSPGGTTLAALQSLDDSGLGDAVRRAMDAARARAAELGAQAGREQRA